MNHTAQLQPKKRLPRLLLAAGIPLLFSMPMTASAIGIAAGDLLVSTSYYGGNSATVSVGQALAGGTAATNSGAYNQVFLNDSADSSFGVTSGITLESFNTATRALTGNLDVTAQAAAQGVNLATSFSSKSELALNVSLDGTAVTFFGYNSPINHLDISNSNTAAVNDTTNPAVSITSATPRAIGQINLGDGSLQVINTNAYSGNNGRAVVLANGNYYLAGNAGNSGKSPKPTNSVLDQLSANTGVQMLNGSTAVVATSINPTASNNTTVVGQQVCPSCAGTGTGNQFGYSVTQYGLAADKTGKDDNFRGMTVFNNTLYVTKGSGGNGIDTVFQVGATGALANGGTVPGNAPITVLPGFTTLAADSAGHPFGIWFANTDTLYVADEGNGTASPDSFAGLQKWSFDGTKWTLDYTLTNGLNLGQNYTVTGGLNADGSVNPNGTGQSYTTSTGGLRNITGIVNADGTATIYGVTSTVSTGTGDQGADPNKLVSVTDLLSATSAPGTEQFTTLQTASYGQVLRGVALAPVPEPETYAMLLAGLGLLGVVARRKRAV